MSRKEQRTAVKVFQNGKCVFALFPTGLSCSWLKLACDRHYQTLNPTKHFLKVLNRDKQSPRLVWSARFGEKALAKIYRVMVWVLDDFLFYFVIISSCVLSLSTSCSPVFPAFCFPPVSLCSFLAWFSNNTCTHQPH